MMDAAGAELDRTQKLLISVDRSMKILEIGPSFGPITPKRDGWNSYALDHADAEALREKYATCADVDTSKIEDVDFVCPDGDLQKVIPREHQGTFDCCIASHVLEHIPNMLRFFQSIESILAENAVVSFALPDKRFCFDFFKPISTTADVLYAHHRKLRRHTKKAAFEHFAYGVLGDGKCGWTQQPAPQLIFMGTLYDANRFFNDINESDASPYVDFHCWYFTPSSFALIVLELAALGYLDWHIERAFPAAGCEFFATLRRGKPELDPEALQQTRLKLMKDIAAEVDEQYQWLVAATQEPAPAQEPAPVEPLAAAQEPASAEPLAAAGTPARMRKWRRKITRKIRRKVTRMVRKGAPNAVGR
jgi:SAM-dependent methyltransferase